MEKLTKQDLKGHDAFVTNVGRWAETVFQHRVVLIGIVVGIFVLGSAWAGFRVYSDGKESKAQELLYSAEKHLKPVNLESKGDLEIDHKESLTGLRDVVKQYPGTQASVVASLDLARLYYAYKKHDESLPLLQAAVKNAKHPVTKGFAMDQLALAYEGKGDCTAAVQQWEKIEKDKELSFLHGNALIKTALCEEKLKAYDKAEQAYRKAAALTNDANASKAAKKYLRVLKRSQSS